MRPLAGASCAGRRGGSGGGILLGGAAVRRDPAADGDLQHVSLREAQERVVSGGAMGAGMSGERGERMQGAKR
jgi:hypothetical protein